MPKLQGGPAAEQDSWACCFCCSSRCCATCGAFGLPLLALLQLLTLIAFAQVAHTSGHALEDCWFVALVAALAGLAVFAGLPVTVLGTVQLCSKEGSVPVAEFPVGTSAVQGLEGTVVISRERAGHGLIRIDADSEVDMAFAQGLVQAQTRLWQMDFNRRLVKGQLSELVGEATLDFDKLFRTLGFNHALERLTATQDPHTASLCSAYVAGINAHLATAPPPTLEHWLFGGKPVRPFERSDTLALALLVGLQLSGNARMELQRMALVELDGLTPERVEQLFPEYDSRNYPTVLSTLSQQLGTFGDLTGQHRSNASEYTAAVQQAIASGRATSSSRQLAGDPEPMVAAASTSLASLALAGWASVSSALWAGAAWTANVNPTASLRRSLEAAILSPEQVLASNNFVVHGNFTESGGAILENDPHLAMASPGVWQALSLTAKDSGYNAVGASFAGAPGIVLGRTPALAWGVTTSQNDAQDIFVLEEVALAGAGGRTGYRHNGSVLAFTERQETIRIAGASPVVITTRASVYGPVINENGGLAYFNSDERLYKENGFSKPLALGWSPLQAGAVEGVLPALLGLGNPRQTSSWRHVQALLANYTAPCQSFVTAFATGDIGFTAPCLTPQRAAGQDGRYPTPGNGTADWVRFVPFTDMPRTFNPPEGFVATANNKLVPHEGFSGAYQGNDWGTDGWRAERIVQLINASFSSGDGKLSLAEAAAIQQNVRSAFAERAVRAALAVADAKLDAGARRLRTTLAGWDGEAAIGSQGASAAFGFVRELALLLRGAVPGDKTAFYSPFYLVSRVFGPAGEQGDASPSSFGSDAACATQGASSCEDLLAKAMSNAESTLRRLHGGSDDGFPAWGDRQGGSRLHQCVFAHQLLAGSLLSCLAGQRASGSGSIHTVSKGQMRYDEDETMPFVHGPTYRALVDLGRPPSESRIAVGPGQSGNAFSPRYGSNIKLLVDFLYEPMAPGTAEDFAPWRTAQGLADPLAWVISPP
ncbi:hypothetical protein FNF28_06301 [Cafeteria roenbergensis]|uniref:Penicillin amidase n=2 Tax=Cafeteria roenbergensis TaxID=33653 RepID=A0A5A8CYL9_CAFRO|nr:hypothetical protein FNF28_06301 [Cafeteria roenbergensis]